MPVYLYGIVAAGPGGVAGLPGIGDPPRPVALVAGAAVAAVVSEVPEAPRAKRRDLLAHERVLRTLADGRTVIPMRFGTVGADADTVRQALLEREGELLGLLERLRGRVEHNLKASLDEETVVREELLADPELRRLRERAAAGGTHQHRVALGEAVAARVRARERAVAERVLERLRGVAVADTPAPAVRGAFLNHSFLTEASASGALRDRVESLGRQLGAAVELRLHGPLPPYSFTTPGVLR
ncbi:GvpL/GvpF family gas vesicle protein [Allostreptomyces psammosilenae]|uniref:Gas vesicle protein n=1 Tax=Allostreptomyces psammosilenae TaxID=1892865 RepID=A0A852ZVY8_9ACTN|nr:GvpL/GvpF family gas vesicle protein [Allostreptomyces psammosilenae]NYI06115.1 hypothetical protein [Allostreptomyces psammosilenae]